MLSNIFKYFVTYESDLSAVVLVQDFNININYVVDQFFINLVVESHSQGRMGLQLQ